MLTKNWWLVFVTLIGFFVIGYNSQVIGAPIIQGTIPTPTPTPTPAATVTAIATATPDSYLFTPTPISAQPTPTPVPTGGPDRGCDANPWQFSSNMTTLRGGHTAVIAEGHLFAIGGGVNDGYGAPYTGIERAAFNLDGTLQPWQRVSDLSSPRSFAAAVVNDDYIYVMGGQDNTVERAQVNPDGSLGSWQAMIPMTTPRMLFATVIIHDYIYAIGGMNEGFHGSEQSSVERAKINDDGTLTNWEAVEPLSFGRKGHVAVVAGNYIYVMGGYLNGDLKAVERAKINADGTIESWEIVNSILVERIEPMGIAYNGYLYLLGGHTTSGIYHETMERAQINVDGSLGKWDLVYPMNRQRWAGAAVVRANRLYAIGGSYGNDNSDTAGTVEWVDLDTLGTLPDYSISINNGILYTNQPEVTLNISAKPGTTEMQLSNDGGFTGAPWERCTSIKNWEITRFGNYVIPRLVYIRYKDQEGNTSNVFQDDIILDVTAPSGSVEIVPTTGTQQRNIDRAADSNTMTEQPKKNANTLYLPLISGTSATCPATGIPNVILQITAQDDVSGVAEMMISNVNGFACATWQMFNGSQAWYAPSGATTTVYVKFRDNAGNVSDAVTDTVDLPSQ